MAHWLTNRGKLGYMQGNWDDLAASAIRIGLLVGSSIPAAMDTEAEVQDLNNVSELLALTGVDEPTGGWYARAALTRTPAAEDDTNNRVNLDAADVVFANAAVTGGETHIYGAFIEDNTVTTSDTTRLLLDVITYATPVALNGSNLTNAIADLIRAS